MSWPAVRTEPIALDRGMFGLLGKAVLMTTLVAPVITSLVMTVTFLMMALGALTRDVWSGVRSFELSGLQALSGLWSLLSGFLFWLVVSGIAAVLLLPLVWLFAMPLAVIAARAGWAGWLMALAAGVSFGLATATMFLWWSGAGLAWRGEHNLFPTLGVLYAGAFWLAIHHSSPDLLRRRVSGDAP